MAVADVPVGGLDHLALTVADLLADLLLGVDLGGVFCHHGGEEFVVGHGGFVHAVILQGHGLVGLQAVPVHPLSQAGGGMPRCCQDGTTGDTSEAIGLPAAGELYPSGARDRINGQTVNSG